MLLWAAVAAACIADPSLYTTVKGIQIDYGYSLAATDGWQTQPEFAAAINTIYMYAPTLASPPPIEFDHGLDTIIKCSASHCSVGIEQLEAAVDPNAVYAATLRALLTSYGVAPASTDTALDSADFAGLGVPSRACTADADCDADPARPTCCDATKTVPGLCCSTKQVNLHDAVVEPALIIIFLSGAGLLAVYWTFTYCRRLHAIEDTLPRLGVTGQ